MLSASRLGLSGAKGAQEVLELGLVLIKGTLGRRRKEREGQKRGCGEAHCCRCDGKKVFAGIAKGMAQCWSFDRMAKSGFR